jgi:nitrate/nitrite-specific signal transduction histidine kinase
MKRRHVLLASAAVGLSGIGLAQVINLNDAINKAGRQRMLSQRMAKSYMALGLGVMHDTADKTLAASMALFDRQLVELKAFAPTPDIKTTYQQLEAKWSEYKGALVGAKPSTQGAASVMSLSNAVLALANQGTVQLEKTSSKPVGKLVNIAGRQRMLSQRMASHYLAASWNVGATNAKAEMLKAQDEFLLAHDTLAKAPENTERIAGELVLAQQQFVFFQAALQNLQIGHASQARMGDVFQTSERILQVMDNITNLYSKIV